jgi:hypothetical protein
MSNPDIQTGNVSEDQDHDLEAERNRRIWQKVGLDLFDRGENDTEEVPTVVGLMETSEVIPSLGFKEAVKRKKGTRAFKWSGSMNTMSQEAKSTPSTPSTISLVRRNGTISGILRRSPEHILYTLNDSGKVNVTLVKSNTQIDVNDFSVVLIQ